MFRSDIISILTLFRPGFFEPSLTRGGGLLAPSPLCYLKTVNAMTTKLTHDDVDNTVFIRLNAAAFIKFFVIRVRRLFEGGVYTRAAFI